MNTSYLIKSWAILKVASTFILWHMVGSLILYHEKYVGRGATLCCQVSFVVRFAIMFYGLIEILEGFGLLTALFLNTGPYIR